MISGASIPEESPRSVSNPNARPARKVGLILLFVLIANSFQAAPAPLSLLHKPAPSFIRSDLNGNRVSLRAYRGKVILLNFWATWCVPCRQELPRFAEWQKQFGPEGLQVIAVSMDDTPNPVRAVVRKLKPDYPIIMGDAKLGTRYGGVLGLPITFLIDRNGRVDARLKGEADLHAMEYRIKVLLAQP
jgi:cytochrome c biogenesis protein CcmG/thiol:disulfide interchange protein DsbE